MTFNPYLLHLLNLIPLQDHVVVKEDAFTRDTLVYLELAVSGHVSFTCVNVLLIIVLNILQRVEPLLSQHLCVECENHVEPFVKEAYRGISSLV